jgi:hypothetical protein
VNDYLNRTEFHARHLATGIACVTGAECLVRAVIAGAGRAGARNVRDIAAVIRPPYPRSSAPWPRRDPGAT